MTLPFPCTNAGVRLRSATVERVSNGIYFVADSFSLIHADRSASCLLQPEQDDLVLIMEDDRGTASIVTVLERMKGKVATLSVDGDAVVTGAGDVSFKSGQNIHLLSPQIRMKALRSTTAISDCDFSGAVFTACGRKLQTLVDSMESTAHKLTQRITRLYRRITDEDAQLGRLHCHVQNECSICAQDARIDAENEMRLNGSKIELG